MQGVVYHPDFGSEVGYQFDWLPDHPDGQVRRSIGRILDYVRADVSEPIIQRQAAELMRRGRETGGRSPDWGCALALWNWVKSNIRFKHDSAIAEAAQFDDPRVADVVEVLIRPADQARLIEERGGVEDCDGFEMYAACLLLAMGIPSALVTVSADPREPGRYTHVYLVAYLDGQRVPMDFSHGPYPGWECPNAGRLKEWAVIESYQDCVMSALVNVGITVMVAAITYWLVRRESTALSWEEE